MVMNAVNLRNISFLKSNWTSHLQAVSGLNCKETQISLEICAPCGIANASHSHKTQFCSFHTRTGTGFEVSGSRFFFLTLSRSGFIRLLLFLVMTPINRAFVTLEFFKRHFFPILCKCKNIKEAKAFEFCCHNHNISTVYTKSLLLKSIYIVAFTVWTHSLLNCNHNARTLVHIPRRPIVVVVNFRFHPTIPDRFAFRYRPENMPKYAERL